ncbi:unnamed protein product, partial [marine sediment metagenome]
EWIMSKKLKDNYWLYIVEYATDSSKRRLKLIQNPREKFKKYEVVSTQIRIKIKNWQTSVDTTILPT